ncbi:MAG: hypothetical protein AAGI30_03955 [Planctomycetota bacterium]
MQSSIARLLAAAGGLASVATLAIAQTGTVNGSGATLQEALFLDDPAGSGSALPATNDFLDLDNDTNVTGGGLVDQLAPAAVSSAGAVNGGGGFGANDFFTVQYNAVGSINGLEDLLAFGGRSAFSANGRAVLSDAGAPGTFGSNGAYDSFRATAVGGPALGIFDSTSTPPGFEFGQLGSGEGDLAVNRVSVTNPVTTNPMGWPSRSNAGFNAVLNSTGGFTSIDFAPIDVPGLWALQGPGGLPLGELDKQDFDTVPGAQGYGQNPLFATDGLGQVLSNLAENGQSNTLPNPGTFGRNTNVANPDNDTVFDTALTYTPIAGLVNFGVGLQEIDFTDLQFGYVTGRRNNGENLVFITRDVGSGTRNGWSNSLGIDPSRAIGDNIGPQAQTAADQVGPDYIPSNKGGSSRMENTVRTTRLGIGYSGAERQVSELTDDEYELLAIRNDHIGGVAFARPNIDNVLDNDENGFRLGGPASFVTLGDPRSALNVFATGRQVPGVDAGTNAPDPLAAAALPRFDDGNDGVANTNPPMANPFGAAYINNLTRSVEAFAGAPGVGANLFTPGEFIATTFIPFGALDLAQDLSDPVNFIPNPGFNQLLQNEVRATNTLANAVYDNFETGTAGDVNRRTDLSVGTYSDGTDGSMGYLQAGGGFVADGSPLTIRNLIAFDFDYDSTVTDRTARTLADIDEALEAYDDRNDGANGTLAFGGWDGDDDAGNGTPEGTAIIEVLGDLNGDGNYSAEDIRFFADGLWINPATGTLDRVPAFERVDTASATQGVFAVLGGNIGLTPLAQANAVPAAGNFFGTQIVAVNGVSNVYAAGYSAADVANADANARCRPLDVLTAQGTVVTIAQNANVTPGAAPTGQDGIVDLSDANYVVDNFGCWNDIDQAAEMDLSADMDGNLLVDTDDLCYVVGTVIGTLVGDLDLDGDLDGDDLALFNPGAAFPRYTDGDLTGDGVVDARDEAVITNQIDLCSIDRTGDTNGDFLVDASDFIAVLVQFGSFGDCLTADFDQDGDVDADDFIDVLVAFGSDFLV